MGKRKERSKEPDPPMESPIIASLKKIADENLRESVSGADVAERHVLEFFGEAAAAHLKALIPELRVTTAQEAFERHKSGATADEISAWLSIRVRDQRRILEKTAQENSDAKVERRHGGIQSVAVRRAPWQAWREWICEYAKVSTPAKAHQNFKNSIVEVIRFRCGAKVPKPSRNASVPKTLPNPRGQDGKAPSEDSIRRNLFNSRAK